MRGRFFAYERLLAGPERLGNGRVFTDQVAEGLCQQVDRFLIGEETAWRSQ